MNNHFPFDGYSKGDRQIRVFISSTFRDMNAERDYLNNIVFPQVEQYCKERFISFVPIDLRWGIPEDSSRNGHVLSVCLEEIDRSRPFFIGIIGSRYGWNPKLSELDEMRISMEQQEWVRRMVSEGASITEMEIEYGVLRNMDIPHACFFIRSENTNIPEGYKEEIGSPAEYRLNQLKNRIRYQQKYPVIEYDTIQQFGETIRRQLIEMIDSEYPPCSDDETISMITRQELSLERHSKTLFNLKPTQSHFTQWISNRRQFLLISGGSCSGTSTVLAYCVSGLRKQYSSKIIYFDFEAIDIDSNPMDALLQYLSLKENRIPEDQWGLIAIDNTYVLSTEDEKRFFKWIKGIGRNTVVAITTTHDSDLRYEFLYSIGCAEINIHNLPTDLKREFINNYMLQYGKRLSAQQLDALLNKTKDATVGYIKLLLRLLVNHGSFETLDDRINSLVNHFDGYWIFHHVKEDAASSFSKIKLESSYSRAITCISLVANGIPESDLLAFTNIKQSEWSFIEPSIRLICNNNSNCLKLISPLWQVATRDSSTPYERALIGRDMINWYLSDNKKWKRCARIVNDIYIEIFGWASELGDLEDLIFAFAKSPDMIIQLKDSELGLLWAKLFNKNMSEKAIRVFGRNVEELSIEESIAYYLRLANVSKSLRRWTDASYCQVEISKIKREAGMVDADYYCNLNTLESGHPEQTLSFIKNTWISLFEHNIWQIPTIPTEQQLLSNFLMFKAYVMRSEWAGSEEAYRVFRRIADPLIKTAHDKLKEIIVLGYSTFAYVFSGYFPMSNRRLALDILQIICSDNMKLELRNGANYLRFMAYTCVYYLDKNLEEMRRNAWWAVNSARLTFGVYSYQYARAHLLYAYANYCITGEYGIPGNLYKNVYVAMNYSRISENINNSNIEWSNVERCVKETLITEYAFFWNTELAIQPVTKEREKLEQKMVNYKKIIGLNT